MIAPPGEKEKRKKLVSAGSGFTSRKLIVGRGIAVAGNIVVWILVGRVERMVLVCVCVCIEFDSLTNVILWW